MDSTASIGRDEEKKTQREGGTGGFAEEKRVLDQF
jgi:hypothetical protein